MRVDAMAQPHVCSICIEPMSSSFHRAPCGHEFCSECLDQWSMVHLQRTHGRAEVPCPNCRREVPVSIFLRHVAEYERLRYKASFHDASDADLAQLMVVAGRNLDIAVRTDDDYGEEEEDVPAAVRTHTQPHLRRETVGSLTLLCRHHRIPGFSVGMKFEQLRALVCAWRASA